MDVFCACCSFLKLWTQLALCPVFGIDSLVALEVSERDEIGAGRPGHDAGHSYCGQDGGRAGVVGVGIVRVRKLLDALSVFHCTIRKDQYMHL